MGSTESRSRRGIAVDDTCVSCPTYVFLRSVTRNFDVMTTIIKKSCFDGRFKIAHATRGRFSLIFRDNGSNVDVPRFVVRTIKCASSLYDIVEFLHLRAEQQFFCRM